MVRVLSAAILSLFVLDSNGEDLLSALDTLAPRA